MKLKNCHSLLLTITATIVAITILPASAAAPDQTYPTKSLRFVVRALAVTTIERSKAIPAVPSLHELGMKDFDFGAWQGVLAPAGTPRAIVAKLNADINIVLKDPEASSALVRIGFTPVGGTAEQFQQLISSNIDKWGRVIRDARIKAE